ncbi:MAG: DegT/DnrJ/EryC1/StrS family aminotransferase, partial [Caldimicrobium sp.]|nr:DegT/DnrJ/EryC1/StrS family aminotransferase [Caldimicrobium sp.]
FVDIDPKTGNISLDALRDTLVKLRNKGKKISAVIVVSIFGNPADLINIAEFCKDERLYMIEDICQAFGAELDGKKVGSFGIASATSFYPTKNLSAFGDGGMIFTNDFFLAKKTRYLKEHGQTAPYYYEYHGVNGRIDEIQCAILRVKLREFREELKKREKLAEFYRENLQDLYPYVRFLETLPKAKPAYSIYSLRVERREELKAYLEREGISCRVYYPIPLHLQPIYKDVGFKQGDLPETEALCEEILSIPFFPYLTLEEALKVVQKIRAFYGK